jgi:hypothetical protein
LLNHSSTPHTSLASDDFVCETCGSLKVCSHDLIRRQHDTAANGSSAAEEDHRWVPPRLRHIDRSELDRIEAEVDTVEMRLSRYCLPGDEIYNSYGHDLSDARLVVEWGYIGEEFVGDGLTFSVDEIRRTAIHPDGGVRGAEEACRELIEGGSLDGLFEGDGVDHGRLLCLPLTEAILSVNQLAQISLPLFTYAHFFAAPREALRMTTEELHEHVVQVISELESRWRLQSTDMHEGAVRMSPLSEPSSQTVNGIRKLLQARLASTYRPDLTQEALLDLLDVSSCHFVADQRL